MVIGLNTYPLKSGHKFRGIGYYTSALLNVLKNDEDIELIEFTKLSELKNVDLVHYPWFDFYLHTLPIRKKYKTIVTIHDTIPLVFPEYYPVGFKGKARLFLQKMALKNVDAIITDSNISKKDIIKYFKIDEKKIFVIPLGVDSQFRQVKEAELMKITRKYNLPEKFLMYTGDANRIKNLPFLIEGFRNVLKQYQDLKLVLVGGIFLKNVDNIDHPELESIKKLNRLIKNYQLENNIIRPGFINTDELAAFYHMATVYVQPSLYEGFGLPVLQALSCGTPVVSSNAGSLIEVGGDAVMYFDPSNLKQFIYIVLEVLGSNEIQNKLSKLGLAQAAKFSWKKVALETKEIYKKVINS